MKRARAAGAGRRRPARGDDDAAETRRLEELVFGAAPTDVAAIPSSSAAVARAPRAAAGPAWRDDDDDDGGGGGGALRVDLAATSRLRKLRREQSERAVGVAEYGQRLREQLARSAGGAAAMGEDAWAALPAAGARHRASRTAEEQQQHEEDDDRDDNDYEGEGQGDDAADDAAVLRRAGPLVARGSSGPSQAIGVSGGTAAASASLPPGTLGVSRLRDANAADPCRAVVQALEFHPGGAVLLAGSLDHRVRFFAVDGKRNSRLASVFFPDLPVASACWTGGDGAEVVVTGRRPYFYAYDVAAGKAHRVPRILGRDEQSLESCVASPAPPADSTSLLAFLGAGGTTVLCSARTKQWVGSLKMEGSVRAAAFSRGPTGGGGGAGALAFPELLTVGGGGEVFRWCLRTQRCLARHVDEGSAGSTAVAASPDGRRYAVGSTSGVVNVYDAEATAAAAEAAEAAALGGGGSWGTGASGLPPRPVKTVLNLTTKVSGLRYNHDGSVLLMSSLSAKDQLKLLHTASGTVFSNWPTQRTPLHFVTAACFSPGGAFLSVGNDRGRALLYRLTHYGAI